MFSGEFALTELCEVLDKWSKEDDLTLETSALQTGSATTVFTTEVLEDFVAKALHLSGHKLNWWGLDLQDLLCDTHIVMTSEQSPGAYQNDSQVMTKSGSWLESSI